MKLEQSVPSWRSDACLGLRYGEAMGDNQSVIIRGLVRTTTPLQAPLTDRTQDLRNDIRQSLMAFGIS